MADTMVFGEPPEGVLVGESVPKESEPDNYTEDHIQEMMNQLKTWGEPYTTMQSAELRETAIEKLRSAGVSL